MGWPENMTDVWPMPSLIRRVHRILKCVCRVVKDQLCFLFPADMEDGAMFYEFKGRNEDYQFVQDAKTKA